MNNRDLLNHLKQKPYCYDPYSKTLEQNPRLSGNRLQFSDGRFVYTYTLANTTLRRRLIKWLLTESEARSKHPEYFI